MTITFPCEICGKSLSTTDDKAGRKAKCPGCGEMFTVPTPEEAASSLAVDLDDTSGTADRALSTETIPCPMCGEINSATAGKCVFCGEVIDIAARNQPRIIEFGDVFESAWTRFKEKMGMAVVGNLLATMLYIISFLPIVGIVFAIVIMAEQSGRDPDPLHFLWLIPGFMLVVGAVLFLTPGLALLYLKIAREEDVDMSTIFSGGRFFLKSAVCSFLFGSMVGIGFLAFMIPGIVLALRYWPYIFVIVDEDPPGLECFSRSAELTKWNWGSMLLVGIAGMFLNIAAHVLCFILQLFTQPFNSMLFATAYVKMTGKGR